MARSFSSMKNMKE